MVSSSYLIIVGRKKGETMKFLRKQPEIAGMMREERLLLSPSLPPRAGRGGGEIRSDFEKGRRTNQ